MPGSTRKIVGNTRKSNTVTVQDEVKLDTHQPIPFELSGNSFYFFEGGERYIPYLDKNDNFFNTLLEAKLLSVTQSTCVTTRADYCSGKSITIDELKGRKLNEVDPQLDEFTSNINNRNETLHEICHEINDHLDTFGNCFVEIIKGQVGREKFVKVYVWNTPECRLGKPRKGEDVPTFVIRSKKLLRGQMRDFDEVTKRPILNTKRPNDNKYWVNEKTTLRTVIFLRRKTAGYPNYGLPIGISALPQMLIEYKGARYNLDNFDNNLSPGGFIGIKGSMTTSEATNKSRTINQQIVGPGKTGRWVVIADENGFESFDVKPFDNQREGSYTDLDKSVEAKIILANQWNKVLAGIDDGSALGKGSGYIKAVYDIALKKVILPRQEFLLQNFIKPLMEICDNWMGTKFASYTWKFENLTPASFLTLIKNIDPAIKRNEVREELGLDTDDTNGDEYMQSNTVNNGKNQPPTQGNTHNSAGSKTGD